MLDPEQLQSKQEFLSIILDACRKHNVIVEGDMEELHDKEVNFTCLTQNEAGYSWFIDLGDIERQLREGS